MKIKKRAFILTLIIILLYNNISYATGDTNFEIGKVVFKLIFYLIVFIVVIIIAIYGTKFIAKNSKRFINSKYIQILDRINVDTNTKIIITEINRKIYILGITNNTIKKIDEFPGKDFDFKKDLKFENQLQWQKNKYKSNNQIFNGLQTKLNQFSTKWNKFIGKEDENDEQKD